MKGSDAVAGTALDDAIFGSLLLPGPGLPRSVDLWPIFHTGVPNFPPYQLATGKEGNPLAAGKPFINNFLPNGGDMLRLNMAVPITPRNAEDFSSLGIIQAAVLGLLDPRYNDNTDIQFIPNMDGFPNGRRLEDDVTRIELQAVAGAALAAIGLWYDDFDPATGNPVTQDLLDVLTYSAGVEANDRAFQSTFPYLAMPFSGTSGCSGNSFSTSSSDLELSISVDNDMPNQFEVVTYTISLTNNGPSTATAVTVAAGLPEGLVFTLANPEVGNYDLFNERWNVGTVQAGETVTLRLALFTLADSGTITNYVQVLSAMNNDLDSTPGNGTPPDPMEDDEAAVDIEVQNIRAVTELAVEVNEALKVGKVYPVPAQDQVNVVLESDLNTNALVSLTDAAGRVLEQRRVNLAQGKNTLDFNVSKLETGLYFISLPGDDGKPVQKKIVVIRN